MGATGCTRNINTPTELKSIKKNFCVVLFKLYCVHCTVELCCFLCIVVLPVVLDTLSVVLFPLFWDMLCCGPLIWRLKRTKYVPSIHRAFPYRYAECYPIDIIGALPYGYPLGLTIKIISVRYPWRHHPIYIIWGLPYEYILGIQK